MSLINRVLTEYVLSLGPSALRSALYVVSVVWNNITVLVTHTSSKDWQLLAIFINLANKPTAALRQIIFIDTRSWMLYTLFWWSLLGRNSRLSEEFCYIVLLYKYFWFKYNWGQIKVLLIPNLIQPGFELMTSRSWKHISCHWDICSNHSVTSDLPGLFDKIYTNKDN